MKRVQRCQWRRERVDQLAGKIECGGVDPVEAQGTTGDFLQQLSGGRLHEGLIDQALPEPTLHDRPEFGDRQRRDG